METQKQTVERHARRIPKQSMFYDTIIPIVFIVFTVILVSLVVFALAVLVGVIRY